MREVARRMAERLALIRLQPRALIDWWSFNGAGAGAAAAGLSAARSVLRVEADDARAAAQPRGRVDALVVAAALGRAGRRLGRRRSRWRRAARSCCGPT